MNRSYGIALIASVIIAFVAGAAAAQTTANGPYYATPSWDQTLPSSTRFIVLSNMNSEAVLDRETGLVWQRSPNGTASWAGASSDCQRSATGGRYGWRLPTLQELVSLLDPLATSGPPLPSGHPFIGVPSGIPVIAFFWTATSYDANPTLAIPVVWGQQIVAPYNFFVQIGGGATSKGSVMRFWCVRGGILSAPQ